MKCKICGYDIPWRDGDRTKNPWGRGKVHASCLREKLKARKRTLELINGKKGNENESI